MISADPNTLTLVDDTKLLGTAQQPLQITAVPQLIGVPHHHINSRHGEASHQETGTVEEAAGVHESEAHGQVDTHRQLHVHHHQQQQNSQQQQQQQQQQQAQQIIIIVTDLNQTTGAVLTSMSGHARSRGRPPIYAAAAAAIQQQGGNVVLPPGQVAITSTAPMTSSAEIKSPPYRPAARHMNPPPNRRDILAVATAASVGPTSELTPEQKLELQRAKRAERAR
ncbi:unnamed protein product [Gongylonema pulchrum]|uniref:Uncharacterized protein n=1 Tax=Gongylonema pulchrum TaxID=637853 RepID=A0A3P7N4T7_9BILA|nr:unnamed protein product [Gongylonema pulchrum]